ncbi:sodium:proton antiporter [Micropruina sp.]|uniref:sodium:proton antiporter n=1 Tax=Micropruina sp. TaxID=2737536 RepID=UPI0039E4EA3B
MTPLAMDVPWWGVLPFVTMLICIAVLPLVPATEHLWERNSVKLAVGLLLGVPVAIWQCATGPEGTLAVLHALVEYGQFIALLLALFVVAGGIHLAGDLVASPRTNTGLLAVGGMLASFVGTTGAAMLLIRPLLRTNAERRHRVHTVVFFIFIVANSGGLLTPLGDPPLFLGMLRGVPFAWTFTLFQEWLFVNLLLLIGYYALDVQRYANQDRDGSRLTRVKSEPLQVHGSINIVFLAMVVAAIAFLPSIDLHTLAEGQAAWSDWVPWRELVFVLAAVLSLRLSNRRARYQGNGFAWRPIVEVAALFVGIFLTMVPAMQFVAGAAPGLPLNGVTIFIFTGGLSAMLDNAPTYATFFELAKALGEGHPAEGLVAGVPADLLTAISLGAVLGGALTYIGNGPNFMVKAVAEHSGVAMPSFGGYLGWAFAHLVPVLIALVCIFLSGHWSAMLAGWAIVAALLARAGLTIRSVGAERTID